MSVFTYALKKHVRMFNKHLGEYNSYYIIKKNGIFCSCGCKNCKIRLSCFSLSTQHNHPTQCKQLARFKPFLLTQTHLTPSSSCFHPFSLIYTAIINYVN